MQSATQQRAGDVADARRKHAARMFKWEDQVAMDAAGRHHATAVRAVAIIRRKVARASGTAEIEQRWLAGQLGVTVRGLQKAQQDLTRALRAKSKRISNLLNVRRFRRRNWPNRESTARAATLWKRNGGAPERN